MHQSYKTKNETNTYLFKLHTNTWLGYHYFYWNIHGFKVCLVNNVIKKKIMAQ